MTDARTIPLLWRAHTPALIGPPGTEDMGSMSRIELEITWYDEHAKKLNKCLNNVINAIGGIVPSCFKEHWTRMLISPPNAPTCTIEGYIDQKTYRRLEAVFWELPKGAKAMQVKLEKARRARANA
ncbi:hypothetical protein B0A48_17302 [Cryoendolithus antarcticus]|uniref:Uncharacterized protein n=1 Tax=Cryoendolithus antarcticus TaxID=1507870 RepID=A0A1V8SC02_9PEZI|nr:hypothetical protein B0A48_17302 [Cryoendolithus antarcticus]